MYTGQFIYCHCRTMLSIGDVLPLCRILEGPVISNVEHHTGDYGAPPPGHLGTTLSSSTTTPTTTSGWGAPPAEARPQHTTPKPTMFGTLQRSSSFDDSDPFSAKATHTISSMLDDLQLDITLRIHEQISEFLSL